MFENGEKMLKKVSEFINEATKTGNIIDSYVDDTLLYIVTRDSRGIEHTLFEGFADIILED